MEISDYLNPISVVVKYYLILIISDILICSLCLGVPVVFPLAGYFAFTKKVTVGGVDVVDHQYMAETM